MSEKNEINVWGGHRYQSSFDVVSSSLYILSTGALALKFAETLMSDKQDDWILLIFLSFAMFHFVRMYYYLYAFDLVDAIQDDHFISRLFGLHGWVDRGIRVVLAVLVIGSVTISLESLRLFAYVTEWSQLLAQKIFLLIPTQMDKSAVSSEGLAIAMPYLGILVAIFILLIIWDINCAIAMRRLKSRYPHQFEKVKETYLRFYYLKTDGFLYFNTLKFVERFVGLITSVLLIVAVSSAQVLLYVAAAIGSTTFLFLVLVRDVRSIKDFWKIVISPVYYVFLRPSSWRNSDAR